MLLRKCGEFGRSVRSAEASRRRRHRSWSDRPIVWPVEQRVIEQPEVVSDERAVGRALGRPSEIAGTGPTDAPVAAAWLWQVLGHTPAAREQWGELLRLAATSAERTVRAEALNMIGQFASAAGDPATAQALFQEALVAGRAGQDAASVARSLSGLAQIAIGRGAIDLARSLEEEGLALRRRSGDTAEIARSLAMLGWLTLESRGAAQAEALHNESLTLRVRLRDPMALGYSLVHLGWLAHLTGRRDVARRHLAEALATVRHCADRWKVVALLSLLGRLSSTESPTRQALLLLTAAEALEAAVDGPNATDEATEHLAEAHRRLDARTLAVTWGGGRDADAHDLVEQALRAGGPPMPPRNHLTAVGSPEPSPLTPRELEVAVLISRGYTNRRIADALVIAERTAETHARNIREKLGLSSRSQVAAWAALRSADSPPER